VRKDGPIAERRYRKKIRSRRTNHHEIKSGLEVVNEREQRSIVYSVSRVESMKKIYEVQWFGTTSTFLKGIIQSTR